MIAIIGAMPEEVAALLKLLEGRQEIKYPAFTLYKGLLGQHKVLIAQCGIGKVNAAALTQLVLMQGAKQVIVTGVAGAVAPDLKVGDIVISSDAVQHDVDVTGLGYKVGEVPGETLAYLADKYLQALALEATRRLENIKVVIGRVVSGDKFIHDIQMAKWLYKTFKASCAEMEGASIAQICFKWSVPFVIIRSISDNANQDAGIDFREFTPLAASRAKGIVSLMLQKMANPMHIKPAK